MMIKSIYVLCLFVFMIVAENIKPYFEMQNKKVSHDSNNILFGIVNGLISHIFVATLIVCVVGWSKEQEFGIIRLGGMPPFVVTLGAFILFDFWMYWWHRANHTIMYLWRFHRMHHTDRYMDTTTAVRFHPGEIIISFLLRSIVIVLIGMEIQQLIVYEVILIMVITFHHSNIRIPEIWDKIIRTIIVSPNMHRVHHSDLMHETNSNYASVFSFWDRIFNSYKKRTDTKNIQYGLKQYSDEKWSQIWGMIIIPLNIK